MSYWHLIRVIRALKIRVINNKIRVIRALKIRVINNKIRIINQTK
jgi:hypothetical protein